MEVQPGQKTALVTLINNTEAISRHLDREVTYSDFKNITIGQKKALNSYILFQRRPLKAIEILRTLGIKFKDICINTN